MASSTAATGSQPRKKLCFGQTHIIQPKGRHQATVVWLHGLGDVGASWAEALEALPLNNIKWIVPTAPVQPVAVMGGFPCNAWFDVGSLSGDAPDDLAGLDSSATHIAELLSNEPSDIKLGVGGFSQGAATSLYAVTCSIAGKYSDGIVFPLKFSVAVTLSGWLPCAKNVKNRLKENTQALEEAGELPLLLCHGTEDNVVLYKFGKDSAAALQSEGFKNLTFKTYNGLGHFTSPPEMDDICGFFKEKLQLQQ